MIMTTFSYAAPESLDEAAMLLTENTGAQLLAGGHTLLTGMKLHQIAPPMLIDLRKISMLHGITHANDGRLHIGSMTTFAEIADDRTIQEVYPALTDGVNSTPDVQVRNRCTLGGSLAYASAGADLPAVLLVLGAQISIYTTQGSRVVAIEDFLAAGGLAAGEIIIGIDLPAPSAGMGSAYEKFRDRANGSAICGSAARIVQEPDGTLSECAIAVTGALKRPMRLPEIESALRGQQLTPEVIESMTWEADGQECISDLAASADYRAYLINVLMRRALTHALTRVRR